MSGEVLKSTPPNEVRGQRRNENFGQNLSDGPDAKSSQPYEVRTRRSNGVVYRRATSSGGCVEIGTNEQLRLIRDSRNPSRGVLSVSPKALKRLLKSIKN